MPAGAGLALLSLLGGIATAQTPPPPLPPGVQDLPIGFGPGEEPRSLQLYGVDPHYVGEAVRRLVGEGRIDHLDVALKVDFESSTLDGIARLKLAEAAQGTFDLDDYLTQVERELLLRALDQAGGVRKKAAALLGMSFRQFRYRLAKHISPEVGDAASD